MEEGTEEDKSSDECIEKNTRSAMEKEKVNIYFSVTHYLSTFISSMQVSDVPKKRYLTRSRGTLPPFAKRICKGENLY